MATASQHSDTPARRQHHHHHYPAQRAKARPQALPLSIIIDDFLDDVEQTLAPATHRSYQGPLALYLRHLRAQLDHEPTLDDLTVETARAWTAHLRTTKKQERGGLAQGEKPVSLATLRTYLRCLKVFGNWVARPPHCYAEESPLKYLKLPREEQAPKVPVEPEDLRKLLHRAGLESDSVCAARGKALLLMLVDGGLRAQELISLMVADVSLKDGVVLVRRAKGKRPRLVAVGDETLRALRRYTLLRDGRQGEKAAQDAPYFQTIQGTAFTYFGLRSWLHRLERDSGVRHVHLHLLRHTSAVETLDAGADLRTVQLKLGHADIRVTQNYLNMSAERAGELQRAYSPVDRLGLSAEEEPKVEGTGRRSQHRPAPYFHKDAPKTPKKRW